MKAVVLAVDGAAVLDLERRGSLHLQGQVREIAQAAAGRGRRANPSLRAGHNKSVGVLSLNFQLVLVKDSPEPVSAGLFDGIVELDGGLDSVLALPLRLPFDVPNLDPRQLDRLLLVGLEVGPNQLNLDRDGRVEEEGQGRRLTVAAQAEGVKVGVENSRTGQVNPRSNWDRDEEGA